MTTISRRVHGRELPAGVAFVFLGILALLAVVGRLAPWVPILVCALSAVTYATYGADKRAAQRGSWRTTESTLHVLAVAGGWPGALVARHQFRHKTRKRPFRTIFWVTVAVNIAVVATLAIRGSLPTSF